MIIYLAATAPGNETLRERDVGYKEPIIELFFNPT